MSINLLPWREMQHKHKQKKLGAIIGLVFLLFIGATVFYQYETYLTAIHQQSKIAQLENKLNLLAQSYKEAVIKKKSRDQEMKNFGYFKEQEEINNRLLTLLKAVVSELPDEVYLTEIQRQDKRIEFLGRSPSYIQVAGFLQRIESRIKRQATVSQIMRPNQNDSEIEFNMGYDISDKTYG